jgi:hypothetical protein
MFTEASSQTDEDFIMRVVPYFPAGAPAHIDLYYHMYGADMGDLYIETASGTNSASASGWTARWQVSGQQQSSSSSSWSHHAYDWTPSGDQVARIRGHTGSDFHSDMAVDDVHVSGAVAGPPPPPGGNWVLQTSTGDSCDTTCSAAGRPCHDGNWVTDEATMRAALSSAGASPDAVCLGETHGQYVSNADAQWPAICSDSCSSGYDHTCIYGSHTSLCSETSSAIRRLCKCV